MIGEFKSRGTSSDVRAAALDKLSAGDNLGSGALDASAHALQLQTMTSTMGKYFVISCDKKKL